jgi:GNAT superfamily N-acetyltransferase
VLSRLLDRADAHDRSSILAWGDLTDAEETFWTALGATRRIVERESDLLLDDVDTDLMARWIDARRERASSVELVSFVEMPPEEHLDELVVARNAMNDAPRDDIEVHDFVHSAQDITREARAWSRLGWELHGLLALESDGSAAAMTTVLLSNHRPDASLQGDTVVLNQHRRRGIGRWIKAAMFFHLRENRPQVSRLRTGNAESNDPMLAINVAMGFEPAHACAIWQADLATLRTGLAG